MVPKREQRFTNVVGDDFDRGIAIDFGEAAAVGAVILDDRRSLLVKGLHPLVEDFFAEKGVTVAN